MKPIIKLSALISLAAVLMYISCKKVASENNNPVINSPPVANAGNDTILIFPADSVILDGSRSSDHDDGIAGYQWAKIYGPTSFKITNGNSIQTPVTNLVPGIYQFELRVTDVGGLFSKDTLQVLLGLPNNHPPIAIAGFTWFSFLQ